MTTRSALVRLRHQLAIGKCNKKAARATGSDGPLAGETRPEDVAGDSPSVTWVSSVETAQDSMGHIAQMASRSRLQYSSTCSCAREYGPSTVSREGGHGASRFFVPALT